MTALALLLDVLAVETSTQKYPTSGRFFCCLFCTYTMAPNWSPQPPPTCRDGGPPARSPSRHSCTVSAAAGSLAFLAGKHTRLLESWGVWGQCADDGWPPPRWRPLPDCGCHEQLPAAAAAAAAVPGRHPPGGVGEVQSRVWTKNWLPEAALACASPGPGAGWAGQCRPV